MVLMRQKEKDYRWWRVGDSSLRPSSVRVVMNDFEKTVCRNDNQKSVLYFKSIIANIFTGRFP